MSRSDVRQTSFDVAIIGSGFAATEQYLHLIDAGFQAQSILLLLNSTPKPFIENLCFGATSLAEQKFTLFDCLDAPHIVDASEIDIEVDSPQREIWIGKDLCATYEAAVVAVDPALENLPGFRLRTHEDAELLSHELETKFETGSFSATVRLWPRCSWPLIAIETIQLIARRATRMNCQLKARIICEDAIILERMGVDVSKAVTAGCEELGIEVETNVPHHMTPEDHADVEIDVGELTSPRLRGVPVELTTNLLSPDRQGMITPNLYAIGSATTAEIKLPSMVSLQARSVARSIASRPVEAINESVFEIICGNKTLRGLAEVNDPWSNSVFHAKELSLVSRPPTHLAGSLVGELVASGARH